MLNTVFTIGHGSGDVESLISAINKHKDGSETYIIDVRSVPYSSYSPQFNREPLKASLKAAGLHYVFMGDDLGARREEPEAYDEHGQVDFVKTAKLEKFRHGVGRIQKGVSLSCNLVLMCSEVKPLECHRFALVSRALSQEGLQVRHIIGDDVITQEQAEEELLHKYQSKIDFLFSSQEEQLDQAYSLLNKAIGYKKV